MLDKDTHEPYDELINITVVYIKSVIRDYDNASDLYIFSRFFAILSREEADRFVTDLGSTDLGGELIRVYNNTVSNANHLYELERRPYFMARLNESQLEEARLKAERKGEIKRNREVTLNMLRSNYTYDAISEITGLTIDEIMKLREDGQK